MTKIEQMVKNAKLTKIFKAWEQDNSNLMYYFIEEPKRIEKLANAMKNEGHDVDKILESFNQVMKGYGIESINSEYEWVSHYYQNIIALYVNRGDTYDTTILFDTAEQKFIVCSWGDWYENTDTYKKHSASDCEHLDTRFELDLGNSTFTETEVDIVGSIVCNYCNQILKEGCLLYSNNLSPDFKELDETILFESDE